MKTCFFLFLLSISAYGQFSRNTVLISGFGSYSTEKNSESDNSTEQFLVGVSSGYFIINKLAVGASINWAGLNQESSYAFEVPLQYTAVNELNESKAWGLGPFARYYLFKGLFVEADYLFGKSKVTNETQSVTFTYPNTIPSSIYSTSAQETKSKLFAIGAGYSLIVTKSRNLGIDIGVFYRYHETSISYSGLSVNLSITGFLFQTKMP